jgi:O-antigen/teichoic acid export membrane protein
MSESTKNLNLTGGSLLAKNSLYNILGQVFPTLAAIFSIPILINALGASGFGVLTLVWMVTGYFSLLDLGISRALTKHLSEKLGRGDLDDIPNLIWTALMLAFLMGLIGALMISLGSTTLAYDVFKIPSVLQEDVETSFYILSISVPIVICNTVLRAILESYQRFDIVNMIRAPIGSLTFLGPVLVLLFSEKLSHIVIALVASRLLESAITSFYCIRIVPTMLRNVRLNVSYISMFLIFGGWITISSIVGPLMLYLDRFLIGSIISITSVAYYATSHEIIIRLMVIPGAIVGVLFPAMGAVLGPNPSKAATMFFAGIKYTFITLFPVILIIFIFAEEGLNIWLGDEFSLQGTTVLQLLAIGALISSLSYFPFAMLHAAGRPDLPAKLHLIESPFYLILAWVLITRYGIEGAAIAWVSRAAFDTIVLYYMAGRELKITYPISRILLITLTLGAFLLVSMFLSQGLYFKILSCSIGLPLLLVFSWKKILNSSERAFVLTYANRLYVSRKS